MPNRKETIVISVLCVLALMLGYWTGPLFDDNGDEETSVKPVVDDNATKTVRKLTAEEEKVVGVYTRKNSAGTTYKRVFLDNRVIEYYNNDKKEQKEAKWSIVNGEIHWEMADGRISVVRINNDGSFTSFQVDGTLGFTYKKIK